jgi:SAM-dependent methyltransferase
VRLKGNFPSLNQLKLYLTRQFKDPKEPFLRHDYLIPYNIYKGMASAEAFEKAGIPLKVLDEKKIYPLYGVWSPTKQGYLELVADYIEKNPKKMKDAKQAIDLGCGTGVLSMLLLLKGGLKKVFGVDKSLIAVRNSRLNAEILEVGDKFKGEIMNLGLDDEVIIKSLEKKKFPKKYDMIICNPPWIIASYVNEKKDLDNGVYDPEERLLKSSFNFASILMIFL